MANENVCRFKIKWTAELINVKHLPAIWKRLKSIRARIKQRNRIPWGINTSTGIFAHVNYCFNNKEGKILCLLLSLRIQNWYIRIIVWMENHNASLCNHLHQQQRKISIVFKYALYSVWSEGGHLFGTTQTVQILIGDPYRQQFVDLNRELKVKWIKCIRKRNKVNFRALQRLAACLKNGERLTCDARIRYASSPTLFPRIYSFVLQLVSIHQKYLSDQHSCLFEDILKLLDSWIALQDESFLAHE